MTDSIENWRSNLSHFISTALSEFRQQASEQMERFAVDCHPWNGSIILAFLSTAEVEESPFLAEAEEMAAWKFYDFASARTSTHPNICQTMQDAYNQGDDKKVSADLFFQMCADVVATDSIQRILSQYNLSKGFKITVSHPDTGKEYYSQVES